MNFRPSSSCKTSARSIVRARIIIPSFCLWFSHWTVVFSQYSSQRKDNVNIQWLVWLHPFQQTAQTTQLPVIICCITSHSPTQTQWLLIEADGSYINLEPEMEAAHFGHLTGIPDIYVLLKEMCYVQILFTPCRKKGLY